MANRNKGVGTIDRLGKIFIDLKENVIDIKTAQERLDFLEWDQEVKQYAKAKVRQQYFYDCLLNKYQQEHNMNPEDVVIQKENLMETTEFLLKVKGIIGDKSFEILWLSAVGGWTQEKIAEKYNVQKPAICKQLQKIIDKLSSIEDLQYAKELLQKPPSKLEASSPEYLVNYPSDFLMNVSVDGTYDKKGRFKSRSMCKVPEMLNECFGDRKTICNKCWNDYGDNKKCTRKEMFKG